MRDVQADNSCRPAIPLLNTGILSTKKSTMSLERVAEGVLKRIWLSISGQSILSLWIFDSSTKSAENLRSQESQITRLAIILPPFKFPTWGD
ncbi:hypothetical protein J6590_069781 [Homalodisca vitripennis]|nr:hypothetical protein J6590_069781 [Homalodisca vitripennis]